MSDGTFRSSHARSLFGLVLPLAALFVIAVSIGTGSAIVLWLGMLLVVSALGYHIVNLLVSRPGWRAVDGTARVISVGVPAAGLPADRCELRLVIEAPGLPVTAQTMWERSVPVAKWPVVGQRLPVRVSRSDPRRVSIRWDAVSRVEETSAPSPEPELVAVTPGPRETTVETARTRESRESKEVDSYLEKIFRPVEQVVETTTAESAVSAIPRARTDEDYAGPVGDITRAVDAEGEETQPAKKLRTSIRGVGASLIVSDLSRSLHFYRDVLGFAELDCFGGEAVLVAGGAKLLLRESVDRLHGEHLSHVHLEVSDLDAVYEELRSKGVPFVQRPRAVVSTPLVELRSATFRDPDGHGLALTSWTYR